MQARGGTWRNHPVPINWETEVEGTSVAAPRSVVSKDLAQSRPGVCNGAVNTRIQVF